MMELAINNFLVITWPFLKNMGILVLTCALILGQALAMLKLADYMGLFSYERNSLWDDMLIALTVVICIFTTIPITLAMLGVEMK